MTELAEKGRTQRSYNEAEKQRGLVALAAPSGNSRLAASTLAAEGFEVPHSVLWSWKRGRPEEYQRIRAELLPRIREEQADAHRALEARQLEASLQATDLITNRLPQMEDKDLINAAGKMDIGSGIHGEKALLHDGQPTAIVQRDVSEVLRKLQSRGVVVDAEVVGEETLDGSGSSAVAVRS